MEVEASKDRHLSPCRHEIPHKPPLRVHISIWVLGGSRLDPHQLQPCVSGADERARRRRQPPDSEGSAPCAPPSNTVTKPSGPGLRAGGEGRGRRGSSSRRCRAPTRASREFGDVGDIKIIEQGVELRPGARCRQGVTIRLGGDGEPVRSADRTRADQVPQLAE